MIWLLPPTLPPPSPVTVSRLDGNIHAGRLRKRYNLLKGECGEGRGKEPNYITAKKPIVPSAYI
jgi:hypothetical protein